MTTLIVDIETLPQDAPAYREQCATADVHWLQAVPLSALAVVGPAPGPVVVEPQPAPSNWKDRAKIAERVQANIAKAAQQSRDATLKARADWLDRCHEWWRAGSLLSHRALVHCLCWARADGGPVHTLEGDEADIVDMWDGVLREERPSRLVAHNATFEADHLTAAALRHGRVELAGRMASPHFGFVAQHRLYHRRPAWVCTQKGWGEGRTKLEHICQVLGLAHNDGDRDPIDGSQVLQAFMEGHDQLITQHCAADVEDTREVWRVLSKMLGIPDAA